MPKFKSSFKLVGSDKQSKSDKRDAADSDTAPKTLHFPEHTPWGDHSPSDDSPADILETIEGQIDRAQAALDRLDEDTDVLFRIDSDEHDDDNTPAAA
jgi:hypothetical protein